MSEQKPVHPEGDDGVEFNPQTGFPVPSDYQPQQQPPYGYGYPQQPYPPQPYPSYLGHGVQDHPQATTAFVLGLVSLVGGFFCLLPILASPFAWVIGHKARKQIDAAPNLYGGRDKATTGMVLGIVGTALLVIMVIAVVAYVTWVITLLEPSLDSTNSNV